MLRCLSIRDFVLVRNIELELEAGLCVLTGETGAGKSILLDALGLCLGDRASARLVRAGARQAEVTAIFDISLMEIVQGLLEKNEYEASHEVLLRRIVSSDGRSRAYVNDRPVSANFLRELGQCLVEVQGQHDLALLLDPGNHRHLLDQYARIGEEVIQVSAKFDSLREAERTLDQAYQELQRLKADEEFLRHVVEEITTFGPQPEEEEYLLKERNKLAHAERLTGAVKVALEAIQADDGAQSRLRQAERSLERLAGRAEGGFDSVLSALERASSEALEVCSILEGLANDMVADPRRLSEVEERLFELRSIARKHNVVCNDLPAVHDTYVEQLSVIDSSAVHLDQLKKNVEVLKAEYQTSARILTDKRKKAAAEFDSAVNIELPSLRLGDTVVKTMVQALSDTRQGREGQDRVDFQVATGPGQALGPLSRIASGGELSRIMLALKVVLSATRGSRTLIFDEVDRGIGGATADAVGARLECLSEGTQVLVITHSPQVAARGTNHWLIKKFKDEQNVFTSVDRLLHDERREEIARMLAGATVTDEARAAAESLMAGRVR